MGVTTPRSKVIFLYYIYIYIMVIFLIVGVGNLKVNLMGYFS
jgi:hypothetical protein